MSLINMQLAFRNLIRNRVVSGINLAGLTIGIAISLLIFSFIRKELTTDQYLPGYKNIYAIISKATVNASQKVVNLIRDHIPEIDHITYCSNELAPQVYFTHNQSSYKIENLMVSDSSFFRVFRFDALYGDPGQTLKSANQVVLTERLSRKIFGNINPVGKTLGYNSTYLQNETIEVGAVIKDLPQNSSWHFDAMLSIQTDFKISGYKPTMETLGNFNYIAFFSTKGNFNKIDFEKKLNKVLEENTPDWFKKEIMPFSALPFSEIYFNSPRHKELKHSNKLSLSIINLVGLIIFLLSGINYINLITAQRDVRLKNVGIMKTMGGSKQKIVEWITTESILMLIVVFSALMLISPLLVKVLNLLTGYGFQLSDFFSLWNLVLILIMFISSALLTGLLPGLIFSSHRPSILLSKFHKPKWAKYLRNGLLIFQFIISISLIICTLVIHRQNNYVSTFNLGFNKENIIYASVNDDIIKHIQSFKEEIKKIPEITAFTFSEAPIGKSVPNWGIDLINKGEQKHVNFAKMGISDNFLSFFGIKLMQGESFSDNSIKQYDFILNETAKLEFNIDHISDARINITNDAKQGAIIGVVRDFNFESMHTPIRPIVFMYSGEADKTLYLKINTSNYTNFHKTIQAVEKLWNEMSPNFPFEFQFLNDTWNSFYAKDKQFQKFLSYATAFSLILSCLGLIGLTYFVIENRGKEISIRKLNGARVSEVMVMLNKYFVKLVIVAFVIATPIAYYAMYKWLENFAYKTNLSWWIFALAGIITLGLALLTVSWQSWRAATRNPVEALRYE